MQDDKDKREGQAGTPAKKQPEKDPANNPRQHRLKLALRENLKRRKSQARGRGDIAAAPSNNDDVSPHDGGEEKPDR
jgi:hypothetical protein